MPRITPSTGSVNLERLVDHDPYHATLTEFAWTSSSPQYGSEPRLELTWQLDDSTTVKDWLSLKLGRQQDGTPSKLRQLLNGIVGESPIAEIKWFDTDTLEWSYADDIPYARLELGFEITLRGVHKERPDGQGLRYGVTTYQSPNLRPVAPVQPPARQPQAPPPTVQQAPRSVIPNGPSPAPAPSQRFVPGGPDHRQPWRPTVQPAVVPETAAPAPVQTQADAADDPDLDIPF
jgi:hypothetical protein